MNCASARSVTLVVVSNSSLMTNLSCSAALASEWFNGCLRCLQDSTRAGKSKSSPTFHTTSRPKSSLRPLYRRAKYNPASMFRSGNSLRKRLSQLIVSVRRVLGVSQLKPSKQAVTPARKSDVSFGTPKMNRSHTDLSLLQKKVDSDLILFSLQG